MKTYEVICLDRNSNPIKVAEIKASTPRKAKESGVRVAKLMGLRLHLTKHINT